MCEIACAQRALQDRLVYAPEKDLVDDQPRKQDTERQEAAGLIAGDIELLVFLAVDRLESVGNAPVTDRGRLAENEIYSWNALVGVQVKF